MAVVISADSQDPDLELKDFIFLEEPKKGAEASKADANRGIPAPIHLVRRGDYLCTPPIRVILLTIGGLIREYEESLRLYNEQQAAVAAMPVKTGYGYGNPKKVRAAAASSPAVSGTGKGKRRKTPEFTDSEDEES